MTVQVWLSSTFTWQSVGGDQDGGGGEDGGGGGGGRGENGGDGEKLTICDPPRSPCHCAHKQDWSPSSSRRPSFSSA